MNEFDRRWKIAAAHAATPPAPESAAPFGFATRVVANWKARPAASLSVLWQRLAWRVLGSVAAALLLLVGVGSALSPADDPLSPDVADTVSELFWFPQ